MSSLCAQVRIAYTHLCSGDVETAEEVFVGTFVCRCRAFRCASDYMDEELPRHLSPSALRYDSTPAQQSAQQTFGALHCCVITVITL